ncbi:NAD-dependent epimerase/dehydratase family protein [Longibacter sp.]|uniref:NAD-dependent epimerase/dehydratase family protein n=1 Tax=Longibacter sp. TaxID=2045415 RepID=UPI003EB6DDFE
MDILVTGSSGYIGSRLVRVLREQGVSVRGVDRVRSDREPDEFVHGDLCDPSTTRRAVKDVDRILHLAAAKGDWGISKEEYFQDNVEATRVLIEEGTREGVNDWVFYSTVSVHGPSDEGVDEGASFTPIESYGASKADAERLFWEYADEHPDARVLIIRPSVVFGPENPDSTNIYRLMEAIYTRRFVMVGPGNAIKSTSYITNLIEATRFLMKHHTDGIEAYIYVDEPPMTTGEMVRMIYDMLGRSQPSLRIPLSVAAPIATVSDLIAKISGIDLPITSARIKKFNRSTYFDAEAIRDEGFRQPVDMREAFRRTLEWHLDAVHDESLL